jgi:hypothetical protein
VARPRTPTGWPRSAKSSATADQVPKSRPQIASRNSANCPLTILAEKLSGIDSNKKASLFAALGEHGLRSVDH